MVAVPVAVVDATLAAPSYILFTVAIPFPAKRTKTAYSSLASAVEHISAETRRDTEEGTTKDELTVEAIKLSIAWNAVVALELRFCPLQLLMLAFFLLIQLMKIYFLIPPILRTF